MGAWPTIGVERIAVSVAALAREIAEIQDPVDYSMSHEQLPPQRSEIFFSSGIFIPTVTMRAIESGS